MEVVVVACLIEFSKCASKSKVCSKLATAMPLESWQTYQDITLSIFIWGLSLICGPVPRTKYLNTMGGSFNGPQRDLDYCSKARCSCCHAGWRRLGMNMRKSTSVMLEAVIASYRTVFESSQRSEAIE